MLETGLGDEALHLGERGRAFGRQLERDALDDELPRAGGDGRVDEVPRPLAPDPVVRREVARREIGQQVDDDLGTRRPDDLEEPLAVVDVHDRRLGAELPHELRARARDPDDLVAAEQRQQPPADRAGGACDEDAHAPTLPG